MIDTTFAIDLIRERRQGASGAIEFLRRNASSKLRMPVFTLCELELGVARSRSPLTEREAVRRFTEYVEVVYPEPGFAEIYAQVVAGLLAMGSPIPLMDAFIATTAVQHAEALVTRDSEHFGLIEGLAVLTY